MTQSPKFLVPRPPIISFLQKQLNGLHKPYRNIGVLSTVTLAFVPAGGGV